METENQQNLANYSTTWIEELALEELNMDESGIVNFNGNLDLADYLDESSINFMNELRDRFELFVAKFNECRGSRYGDAQIRIFKISNTVNDFMLFRNSLRLVLARKAHDVVTLGFLSNGGELVPARIPGIVGKNSSHEIKAHVGPFNNITWRFQGEIVDIDALVRFYISEFIRNSSR